MPAKGKGMNPVAKGAGTGKTYLEFRHLLKAQENGLHHGPKGCKLLLNAARAAILRQQQLHLLPLLA